LIPIDIKELVMSNKPDIKVLLIDDEQTLLDYLSKRLLKEGFTVKATFSGEEALEVAADNFFDVAVVDLKMPGIDGVVTQKRLKEIQPLIQCIVLTGHGSIDSALESGQQDAYKYLLKPIDYENLVETIKEAHQKKEEIQSVKFKEQVEEIYRSGMGAKGIKKAIKGLRKIYGIE
jgi:two-component system NtrC family response regulator